MQRQTRVAVTRYDELAMPAPRLFVITARDASLAVVVRRGPASWAQLTLWNTDSDDFTPGAWFRGRIYEE